MSLPSVTFRSELPPVIRKELDQHDSELTAYLLEEHDDDGHHTNITAQSIIVGDLIVQGDLTAPGLEGGGDLVGESLVVTGPATMESLTVTPGPTELTGSLEAGPATLQSLTVTPGPTALFGTTTMEVSNIASISLNPGPLNVTGNVAVSGTITTGHLIASGNVAAAGQYVEQGRATGLGYWIPVPFNAGNFSGGGSMTWTVAAGDVSTNYYTLLGKTAIWNVNVGGTLGGTPAQSVVLNLPVAAISQALILAQINTGGAYGAGIIHYLGGGQLSVYRLDLSNWVAGTITVAFQIVLQLA